MKSSSFFNLSGERSQVLQNLLNDTGYQLIQNNGQRIYSPSASSGISPPPKGTEIFIGNLPPDLYEDEIIPLFSKIGAIYNVRLMLDFFGKSRGYAFVSYFRTEHAYAAVQELNNYKIRKCTKIAVNMSVDNRRLFIGNIPRRIKREEIHYTLEKFVDGIKDVILYQEPHEENMNRGFVFVEFHSHRLAAIARRQLAPGNLIIWGQALFVDWAEPLPVVNPIIMKLVTKLYLSNIPVQLSNDNLKNILFKLLNPINIIKVHKINNYAFVHFTVRKYAEEGYAKLLGLKIMDKVINVEWARPIEYSKTYRAARFPETFCRSVPPSMRRIVLQTRDKKKQSVSSGSGSSSSFATERYELWDFPEDVNYGWV